MSNQSLTTSTAYSPDTYGFTDEELDFIINYDIKYRMGNADDETGNDE